MKASLTGHPSIHGTGTVWILVHTEILLVSLECSKNLILSLLSYVRCITVHAIKFDVLGDLATAVRKYSDIHFGLYYSLFEWFHPLYLQDKANGYKTQEYISVSIIPYSLH